MDAKPPRAHAPVAPLCGAAHEVLMSAIRRRDEAWSTAEVVRASLPEADRWSVLADHALEDAESSLVLAILGTSPEFDSQPIRVGSTQDRWPTQAVRIDGRIYVALADPSRDRDDWGGNGRDMMRLAIIEGDHFLDVDDAEGMEFPPTTEPDRSLTSAERHVLNVVGALGEQESLDRLYLAGPYAVVHQVCMRLGSDAVAELRRMIEAGEPIRTVG